MTDTSWYLLERSRQGDQEAFATWFNRRRAQLVEHGRKRLPKQLQRRIDASDVVQEVYLEANRRVGELKRSELPIEVWIQILFRQRLIDLQRKHLGADCRAIKREQHGVPEDSRQASALDKLVGDLTSPSLVLQARERQLLVRHLLDLLPERDAEILRLRHLKNLSNAEAAIALCIRVNAASNRYVRALRRFRDMIQDLSPPIRRSIRIQIESRVPPRLLDPWQCEPKSFWSLRQAESQRIVLDTFRQ